MVSQISISMDLKLVADDCPLFPFRLKFDDDRVTPATLKDVLEENYGGEPQGAQALNARPNIRTLKRFTNAYMLVYLRECMMDEILSDVTTADIPPHLSKYSALCKMF